MPLPSSGPISFSQVNVELGRASNAPLSLNDPAVRNLFLGVSNPTSIISMLSGYGKANQFVFSFAGGTNVDLRAAVVAAGWNQTSKVIATNTGTISSASTGSYALTISGSFPNGLEFTNNGVIIGRGGNGGRGGSAYDAPPEPSVGSVGGPAMILGTSVTITNNGTISGGGGGGGGGGYSSGRAGQFAGGGGGGGIGGAVGGAGGLGGGSFGSGTAGSNSATIFSGSGQPGYSNGTFAGGAGGNGGGYGSSGSTGGTASQTGVWTTGAAGGTPGAAIAGNSWATWVAFGNRYGSIS